MSIPSRDDRQYDLVLFGASGFTGRLVVDWICGRTGRRAQAGDRKLKWAIAGRNFQNLNDILEKRLNDLPSPTVEKPSLIVVNSEDVQLLQKMASSTRVVLSTVGPFAKYGESLVAACAKNGTDYVDSTGEFTWVRSMIDRYGAQASKNGAILVSCCGFDSVPSDLGAYLSSRYLANKLNTSTTHVQGLVQIKGGGVSGGTIASVFNMLENADAKEMAMRDEKFLLNPDSSRVSWSSNTSFASASSDQKLPSYFSLTRQWTTPFIMAVCNTRIARRTAGLFKDDGESYGDKWTYNESVANKSIFHAVFFYMGMVIVSIFLMVKPLRNLVKLSGILPQPGEGPSLAKRSATRWNMKFVASGENDKHAIVTFCGRDPGYDDTSRMLSEMALLLAFHRNELPANVQKGGYFTPAYVGRELYANRLRNAGITISEAEFVKGKLEEDLWKC